MKIAVLGASGQTGQYLVQQALQGGHTVTAVVRDPGKITESHENLKVVQADVFSADSLRTPFQEQDAVVSCLGFPPSPWWGVTGYTRSLGAVLSAMRDARVGRLVAMTSWYTQPDSGAGAPLVVRYVLLPLIRSVLTDMFHMETALQGVHDLNWTVVRPPGLQNLPASEKDFLTHEGYSVPGAVGSQVARGDVARFLLSQLDADAWVKKGVAMHTK
uniref:Flavin reductase (NADPH)-like n=1 Tax=Gadus morhua TaxID=8049 RepID=A0A8C5ABL3_GADMO